MLPPSPCACWPLVGCSGMERFVRRESARRRDPGLSLGRPLRNRRDLMLEVEERVLAHGEEPLARPVEIEHQGDDRPQDDDEHEDREGLRRRVNRPAL